MVSGVRELHEGVKMGAKPITNTGGGVPAVD